MDKELIEFLQRLSEEDIEFGKRTNQLFNTLYHRYLPSYEDKNSRPVKDGDLIKESWYSHGIGDFGDGIQEFKTGKRNFRFITYETGMTLDINRVNRPWPASGYEFTLITPDDSAAMEVDKENAKYDEYYKCWREQ